MNLRELLAQVAPAKLADADSLPLGEILHDAEGRDAPMIVRLFTVVGTWIGAWMAAMIFAAMELHEILPLALVLGAGLMAGASILSRRPSRSLVATQVVWALALGSQALIGGAIAEADPSDTVQAMVWLTLSVGSMFLIRASSYQIVSAISAVAFATWLANEMDLPMYPLWVALPVTCLAVAAWVKESSWSKYLGGTWPAIAYGLPLGVAIPLTFTSLDRDGGLTASGAAAPISTLLLLGLTVWVLIRAKDELREELGGRVYALGLIAAIVALAARHVPGVTLSLLLILVAHLRRSRPLQGIAIVQLSGFLFFFYYQLETTLLLKSLWVISTGVVLMFGAWLSRPGADMPGVETHPRNTRWKSSLLLVALTAGVIVSAIAQKESLLSTGKTVLLPLAPRDPRSLIQGDYMVLRYRLSDEVRDQIGRDFGVIERNGELVIEVDEEGVGHFMHFSQSHGHGLAPNELLLDYRVRDGWRDTVQVGAESYFFEEGTASIYQPARFGEVVVSDSGEVILVGLRDENKRPLGVALHNN